MPDKHFWAILLALILIFFLSVATGATWGLPAFWHADEQLHLVKAALATGFDGITLNVFYPTLPFFTMLAGGKMLSYLPVGDIQIMAGIRLISAMLGVLVILLTAVTTLTTGRSRSAALVAAALVMFSSGFATIAHHAIVDIYLVFFVTLASFLLLKFIASQNDIWLLLGFFAIGLAASSKYNGASLLLAATLIAFLFAPWRSDAVRAAGRMLLAFFVAFIGFFVGTPQAILNITSYLERLMPFLERQRLYAGPRSLGIIGQWDRMLDGLGVLLFLLFAFAAIWTLVQAVRYIRVSIKQKGADADYDVFLQKNRYYLALLLILIAFELPIAMSQFYPMRYMVPAYPLLAVLSVMMLDDLWLSFQNNNNKLGQSVLVLVTLAVLLFSALRFASVFLIFSNDSRFAASAALKELIPPGTRTEYTLYPPHLPTEERVVNNYPLKVFKFEEDIATHTGWNMGEEGIELRRPDYLVVDRKTYTRFEDDYVCDLNPVECRFFSRLLNGETNYELVEKFDYHPPPYLPRVKTDFANIEVLLYERQTEQTGTQEEGTWRNSLNAQFGEYISLPGYDLVQTGSGGKLEVILYWTTTARLAENYKVFIHCLDEDGQIIAQSDNVPAGGSSPTEYWLRDETVKDEHVLSLPGEYTVGDCRLQVGLYLPDTGKRLPALLDGLTVEDGAIRLHNNGS